MTKQIRAFLEKKPSGVKEATEVISAGLKRFYKDYSFVGWVDKPRTYIAMRADNASAIKASYGAEAKLKAVGTGETFYVRCGINGVVLGLSKPRRVRTSHVEAA